MIKRYALFFGTVDPENVEEFRRQIIEESLPMWRKIPGVLDVDIRFPVEADEGAPEMPVILHTCFATIEDMRAGLASPERDAAKAKVTKIVERYFTGAAYHYVT